MLCAKFGWNWLSGSGEEDFLNLSMYFHYFVIISPCVKFGWNWPSGSGDNANDNDANDNDANDNDGLRTNFDQ